VDNWHIDQWHKVKYEDLLKCNCSLCQPLWICPICEIRCTNRIDFEEHYKKCEKEFRKEKEG